MADSEKELDMGVDTPPQKFEQLATGVAERDIAVDLPRGNGDVATGESLEDAMQAGGKLTDLQATLHRLYPKFALKIIDQVAQVAGVSHGRNSRPRHEAAGPQVFVHGTQD